MKRGAMNNLIKRISGLGIKVEVKEGKLSVDVPNGVDASSVIADIKANKDELIAYLEKFKSKSRYQAIPKCDDKPYYKLSSAQNRIYFLQQYDPKGTVYNMPQTVKLEGELDKKRLHSAFVGLISKHESLRTSFIIVDDIPVQKINRTFDFEIEYFSANEDSIPDVLNRFVRPFDLSKESLIRVGVVNIPDTDIYVMIVDMHHIISDGVSQGVLVKDFITIYDGNEPEEVSLTYKDFAEWQQSEDQKRALHRHKDFWLEQFSDIPDPMDLPLDSPRPAKRNYEGGLLHFNLDSEETALLKEFAEEGNTTLYVVVLSVFNILLSKLSNSSDVTVGTAAAGRQHANLSEIIGMFVNTLALRNRVEGNMTFASLTRNIHRTTLKAFDHQGFQYEDLIETLKVKRDSSRNPLFDVLFAFQNFDNSTLTIPGLKLSGYDAGGVVSKFDLSLTAAEIDGGLNLSFEYAKALFEHETIERFGEYFRQIVRTILVDKGIEISKISLLTDKEQYRIINEFNNTATTYPRESGIIELFEKIEKEFSDKVALTHGDNTYTYKSLNDRANQIARSLSQQGVKPGDHVGIYAGRSASTVLAMLATLKCGAGYLPLDPDFPESRLCHMIKDGGIEHILCQTKAISRIESLAKVIDIEEAGTSEDTTNPDIASGPSSTAYVIYTSGSTGMPKGVSVMHRNVVRLVSDPNYAELDATTKILQTGAPVFDAITFEIWGSLLNGGQLFIIDKDDIIQTDRLGKYLKEYSINTLWLTASLFDQHINNDKSIFQEVKQLIVGGEALTTSTVNALRNTYPDIDIINGYGPTENTTFSVCHHIKKNYTGSIPIGKPVSNSTAYIVDKFHNLQPIGIPGELLVGGDGVSKGYLNLNDLTKEKFIDDPYNPRQKLYCTGDLARWMNDGTIQFIGRLDSQVKIRGFRVELGEIENRLLNYKSIERTIVTVYENAGNKILVAYFTSSEEIDIKNLKEYLAKDLPDYMIPASLMRLDQLSLTTNGKIDTQSLPAPNLSLNEGYSEPETITEAFLVDTFSVVLNVAPEIVSVTDSFFDLGGQSLRATVLLNKIRKAYNVDLSLRDIFVYQSARGLGMHIDSMDQADQIEITKAPIKDFYPTSAAQRRMFYAHQTNKSSLAYNNPEIAVLAGKVNKELIKDTFEKLIDRHESLRTTFTSRNGIPVQIINPTPTFDIGYLEGTSDEVESHISEFIKPFDIEKDILFRVALLHLTDEVDRYVLIVDTHHIVSDGVSLSILIKDFMSLYNGDSLPKLPLQYKDFAWWQDLKENRERLERQKSFWQDHLYGDLPVLNISADYHRPPKKTDSGANLTAFLSPTLTNGLKKLINNQGTTLFTALMCSYTIFLNKLSGQNDIIVGTPVAGRKHDDLEGIVGMFVNTLPVRTKINERKTFLEFLKSQESVIISVLDNQEVLIDELIETLNINLDQSRNPIFDVAFGLQNFETTDLSISGLKVEGYNGNSTSSKFDLTVSAGLSNDKLFINFEYSTDLFKEETISRYSKAFLSIIQKVVENPDAVIKDIELITDIERRQILEDFNNTRVPYESGKSVIELFHEQVLRSPGSIAVSDGNVSITYKELNQKANRLAAFLKSNGTKKGDNVGVFARQSIDSVVAFIAILKAVGVYLPLDPDFPKGRIDHMIQDGSVKTILMQNGLSLELTGVSVYSVGDSGKELSDNNPLTHPSPNDPAYVIYTSGSTGDPKGVVVTHQNIVRLVNNTNYAELGSFTKLLQTGAPAFDATTFEIWGSLLNGGQLNITNKETILNNKKLGKYLREKEINTLWLTSSLFDQHVKDDPRIFAPLEQLLVGGDALTPKSVYIVKDLYPQLRVINGYGPTENTTFSVCHDIQGVYENIPIGKPIHNSTAYIVNKDGQLQPVGVPGELIVGGDGVSLGYLNNPKLTDSKFKPDPFEKTGKIYYTGDLASWLPDGTIRFLGRVDNQVKIRGYRIELGEIENELTNYPGIHKATVITVNDESEKYLAAYYVSDRPLANSEIKRFVSGSLPSYMVPAVFMHLDKMPLTSNGKVDTSLLPEPKFEIVGNSEGSLSGLEKGIAEIWADILKIDAESMDSQSDFFDIGGQSLRAISMISKISQKLNIEVSLDCVFAHTTIRSLVKHIRSLDITDHCPVQPAPIRDYYV
ncbi:MAG: amino acid adenylation domain-containing protein, partial [Cyclobacteriaceae bacterium]